MGELDEFVEDRLLLMRRDPDPGIQDLEAHALLFVEAAQAHDAGARIADRVADEILQHLPQEVAVAADDLLAILDDELDTLGPGLRLERGAHAAEHRADREIAQVRHDRAGLELAHVEERVHQLRHRRERLRLGRERRPRPRIRGQPLQRFVEQIQRLQRLAQVVARRREERALRAVRTIGLGARRTKCVEHRVAFAHVADRARHQQAPLRRERAQADLDRKLRAVAAPGAQTETRTHRPVARGFRVRAAVRRMGVANALGQQHLHVSSDHLRARIAEQSPGLHVRVDDRTVTVGRNDGVRRRIEQCAQLSIVQFHGFPGERSRRNRSYQNHRAVDRRAVAALAPRASAIRILTITTGRSAL